jgi:hypothetical protein
MIPPDLIARAPERYGLLGLILIAFATRIAWTILRREARQMTGLQFAMGVALAAGCTVAMVFVVQLAAVTLHELNNPDQVQPHVTGQMASVLRGLVDDIHGPQAKSAAVLAVAVFVIGFGYAASWQPDLSVFQHLLSYSAGVGLSEELFKLALAVLICRQVLGLKVDWRDLGRPLILAAIVAGIGFGVGESLLYFGAYAAMNSTPMAYVVRVLWCVPLHAAWSVVAATFIVWSGRLAKTEGYQVIGMVLLAVAPAALLHGGYDAYALHRQQTMWVVGIASFLLAAHRWSWPLPSESGRVAV